MTALSWHEIGFYGDDKDALSHIELVTKLLTESEMETDFHVPVLTTIDPEKIEYDVWADGETTDGHSHILGYELMAMVTPEDAIALRVAFYFTRAKLQGETR